MSLINQLRQPEYVGENRCSLCTIVNIVIAIVVSVFVTFASPFLGVGVFVFSLSTIYLRGYLVPGTPTLTKRYFPKRVLRWFGKEPMVSKINESIEIDPERKLLRADAIEPCQEQADLCLTSKFRKQWRERIHIIREDEFVKDRLANTLNIIPEGGQLSIDQRGSAFVAYTGDVVVGQWESQAALVADIAGATELSQRVPNWENLTPAEIFRILTSLRIFVEQCPECDGPVQIEQELVESCCQSYEAVASTCQDCGARLFEQPN